MHNLLTDRFITGPNLNTIRAAADSAIIDVIINTAKLTKTKRLIYASKEDFSLMLSTILTATEPDYIITSADNCALIRWCKNFKSCTAQATLTGPYIMGEIGNVTIYMIDPHTAKANVNTNALYIGKYTDLFATEYLFDRE